MDQYFFAILPPPELQAEIRQIQLFVKEHYRSSKALNAPPHLTVQMPFRRPELEMKQVVSAIPAFSKTFIQFKIELDGFGCFDNRTIYIKVLPNASLAALQRELLRELRTHHRFAETELAHIFSPHISVARRDLNKRIFPVAWEYFSNKHFRKSFLAAGLSLLRHMENQWHEMEVFPFNEAG